MQKLGLLSTETSQEPPSISREGGEGFFLVGCRDRTRSNGHKSKEGGLRLGIRKKFLTVRVMRRWLPREVEETPSWEALKARMDGALLKLF